MKRLVVLLIVLIIVLVAVAAQMKRNPVDSSEARLGRLTAAEKEQLEQARRQFAKEQSRLLDLRKHGASAADLSAQERKTNEAAERVMALGGAEELRTIGERGRAGRYGGRGGMRRGAGPRAGRRGSTEGGQRPGGLAGESAPAEGNAGASRGR